MWLVCRKTDSIHHHHHPEGVVYRGFCPNSGTGRSLKSHFQEVVVYRISLPIDHVLSRNFWETPLRPFYKPISEMASSAAFLLKVPKVTSEADFNRGRGQLLASQTTSNIILEIHD